MLEVIVFVLLTNVYEGFVYPEGRTAEVATQQAE